MAKELLYSSIQVVELTGRMGSGKSVAAGALRSVGVTVVDADKVAHDIMAPGMPAYNDIIAEWPEVETDAGIDRVTLRELTFGVGDNDAIEGLENITHPRIKAETLKQLNDGNGLYVVHERPALKKPSSIHPDHVLVIDQPNSLLERDRIIKRARSQGDHLTEDQITEILRRQLSRNELLDRGDNWIRNDGTRGNFRRKVFAWNVRYTDCLIRSQKKLTK